MGPQRFHNTLALIKYRSEILNSLRSGERIVCATGNRGMKKAGDFEFPDF
jgi:hypothetical protein